MVAVNDAYRLAPWADVLYAADPEWWSVNEGGAGFGGVKFSQNAKAATKWGLRHIASANLPGLSFDPSLIHQGQNSGYQAINLAIHLGAVRILLLGFDCQADSSGKLHWFGSHGAGLNNPTAHLMRGWVSAYRTLVEPLRQLGIEVVNCSRETAIDCFPRMPIGQALQLGYP